MEELNTLEEELLPGERKRMILQDIQVEGVCSIAQLEQKYRVSKMTIRRDLAALEEEGLITRTHGGALRKGAAAIEPGYAAKQELHAQQKARIAEFAARKLVTHGDIIILEGGTTTTAMARYLKGINNLTVITNGLYTTNELRHLLPETTVICTGGMLREVSSTFVGPSAERFFQEVHPNKVFLSATGMTLATGFTDPNVLETQVKKAMISSAEQVIMLLDSSKFGIKSLVTSLPINGIHTLVTDQAAPVDILQHLREQGIQVYTV